MIINVTNYLFIYFLYSLVRFLHPTDKELRHLLGLKKKDSKQNKRLVNGQNDNVDIFQIPKNLDISVSTYQNTIINIMSMVFINEIYP